MYNDYPESYQNGYDALKTMVDRSGYDRTQLAYFLMENRFWPSLSHDALTSRFRACLNPDKDQYFKLSEVVAMMSYTGRYDPLFFICDCLGMERPQPIPEQIRMSDVLQQVQKLMQSTAALGLKVEELMSQQEQKPRVAVSVPEVERRGNGRQLRWSMADRYSGEPVH